MKFNKTFWATGFLVIFFLVGFIGLYRPESQDFFITLMPGSILLSLILLFLFQRKWRLMHIVLFACVALLGYSLEVAGVMTGEIFGTYTYGRALGIQLWDTPLMIGLNWLMLIYCVYGMLHGTRLEPWLKVLTGSALMLLYDYIMEPVAIRLDMWYWADDRVPLQNYVAWFFISVVMLSMLRMADIRYTNKLAPALFFIQMGFFLLLNLFLV